MADMLQVKIFTDTNKDTLIKTINTWMEKDSIATEHYLDMQISTLLCDNTKKLEPVIQYTALIIFRK